jgi:hypothetical protein
MGPENSQLVGILSSGIIKFHIRKVRKCMADRKQFENVPAPDPELNRLLDASRSRTVSEEELREQRISFAFGNALGRNGSQRKVCGLLLNT